MLCSLCKIGDQWSVYFFDAVRPGIDSDTLRGELIARAETASEQIEVLLGIQQPRKKVAKLKKILKEEDKKEE